MKFYNVEYPSLGHTFRGSSQVISDIFTGKRSVKEVVKSWNLLLMGAGHEGFILWDFITTVFLEA